MASLFRRRDTVLDKVESWMICGTEFTLAPGPGPATGPPAVTPVTVPAPVVPPAPSEVWGQLDIPLPETRISPRVRGLVGFETWLWYDQPTTLDLTLTLPPAWTLTIHAHATHYHWDLGDGTTLDANTPGHDGWAATTAYQYPCTCQVTATVTWTGTYTITLPDTTTRTINLGTRPFTGPALPYPVHERQAVITANH